MTVRAAPRSCAKGPSAVVGFMLAVILLGAPASVQAQYYDAGGRKQQTVAQQLEAAAVGDSVRVMLEDSRTEPEGVIVAQDSSFIRLRRSSGGMQTLQRRLVYAVTPLDEETQARLEKTRDALVNRPDPNQSRLFLAPTGRTLDAGQVYLADYDLFFPSASVGIGSVLDMRAGMSVMPNTVQAMYGGAKIGLVQIDGFNLAVGGVGLATTNVITVESGKDEYGGVGYAVGTIGSPRGAVTFGAGYVATGGALEEQSFALLGGEVRLPDSRVKLMTENYLLYGSGAEEPSKQLFGGERFGGEASGVASLGVRIIGSRASLDLGAATSDRWWDELLPVAPIINFSYSINGP